jgi:hypothetical protein
VLQFHLSGPTLAGQIGSDVGGVTCICIPRALCLFHHLLTDNLAVAAAKRDVLMLTLFYACIRRLQDQGMKKMFPDAVASNVEGFKKLGKVFQAVNLLSLLIHSLHRI